MNQMTSHSSSNRNRSARRYAAYDEQHDGQVNLREIFNAVRRGKWVILLVFLLTTGAAVAYVLTTEPEYEAYSVLLIKKPASGFEELTFAGGDLGVTKTPVLTELEILEQSTTLAEQVAIRLMEAATVPETNEPLPILFNDEGEPLSLERLTRKLQSKLVRFSPAEKGVSMIRITATSTIAGEAVLIADLYAEEYQKRNQEKSRAGITASREFLKEQEQRYRGALDDAEADLEAVMQREGAVALDTEGSLLVRRMAEIDAERGEANVELGLEQAALAALTSELDRIEPGLASRIASGVENEISSLQKRIANLEAEANEFYVNDPSLRGNEGANPDLAEIYNKIQQFRAELDQLSQQFVSEMMNLGVADVTVGGRGLTYVADLKRKIIEKNITIRGLEAKLDVLQQRVVEYETRLRDLPRKSTQFAQLQREKKAVEDIYLLLGEKAQEARVAEESELGYVEVVRQAIQPTAPIRPQKKTSILLGMLVGLALGLGLTFVRQAMDHRIYQPEDLTRLGINIVGVVPRFDKVIRTEFARKEEVEIDGLMINTALISLLNPISPITECYRGIHTNLQFSLPDKVLETMLVTSGMPEEGKTVTATNLAVTMARSGRRTLYVDADLRRPRGHLMFGLSRKPGLSDVLLGKKRLDPKELETGVDGLYALLAGRSVPNPAELLGSKRMRSLIEQLKQHFDVVIFDTAPMLLATDAMLLSTQCDVALAVVASGQTDTNALVRMRQQLEHVGASLAGVVLNRLDTRGTSGYGYDYGYGDGYRYQYYGYDEERPGKRRSRRSSRVDKT